MINIAQVYKDFSSLHQDSAAGVGTPVREQLMDNMVSVLNNITVGGGYNTTVKQVLRLLTPGSMLSRYPGIVLIEVREGKSSAPGAAPTGLLARRLTLRLELWISENNDNAGKLNTFLADVEKAVLIDVTRGGLAVTTELDEDAPVSDEAGAPLGSNMLQVAIQYRTLHGDPTVAR